MARYRAGCTHTVERSARSRAERHAIRREVDTLLRERFEPTHTTLQVEHAPGLIKLAR